MKKSVWFLSGLLSSALFFCQVQVYHGHTLLFGARYAMAAYNPAWVTSVDSAFLLTSGNWSNYPYVNLTSYVLSKNKGGGLVALNSSDTTSAQNACTIFVDSVGNRFYRELTGPLTAFQCGALGDSTNGSDGTDDTSALQAGINTIVNGPIVNGFQQAPGGEFAMGAGTFRITSTLAFGPGLLRNVGAWFHGAGNGATVLWLQPNGTACAINDYTFDASSTISDMLIVGGGGAGGCSVNVQGNGNRLHDLWLDAQFGILVTGATDVQMHDILCDQCQGAGIQITDSAGLISSQIAITNFEAFGGNFQTNTRVINCTGAHHGITFSGVVGNVITGAGIALFNGCNMSVSNYSLDAVHPSIGDLTTNRGVWVDSGSTLTLGFGSITGFNAEGIFVGGGGTVYDGGAQVRTNVNSGTAVNPYEVAINNGSYFKSSGFIEGGTNIEAGLVLMGTTGTVPAGAGKLGIGPGVQMFNSKGTAVTIIGNANPVVSVVIDGVTIDQVNVGNNAGNTPILITGTSGVNVANITNNIITQAFTTTHAIDAATATGFLNFSNNLSLFGTFPSTAGNIVSTNNRNF